MRCNSGYTLVEMAVVLAVSSVLLAVVAPDFIVMTRLTLVERAGERVQQLVQAATDHYFASSQGDPSLDRVWPGQLDRGDTVRDDAALRCLLGEGPRCAERRLSDSQLQNPWGHPHTVRVLNDALIVETLVPAEVTGAFESALAGGTCDASSPYCGLGPAVPGFVPCCAVTPRPGFDASLGARPMTFNACEAVNGTFDEVTGRCETQVFDSSADCVRALRVCPDGYTLRGIDVEVRCDMIDLDGRRVCDDPIVIAPTIHEWLNCCRNP